MYSILFKVASILLFSGFLLYGECAQFRFPNNTQPCILVNIDATFNLSRTDPFIEYAPAFDIDGATVVPGKCVCGNDISSSILMLELFPSSETLKFIFKKITRSSLVNMAVTLKLDPAKHFENATDAPFEIDSSDYKPVGERNMSYKCDSEETLMFDDNLGYSLVMTFTNFKAQGYDVVDGNFSPEEECDMDKDTTTPMPTTQTTQGRETTVTTPEAASTEPSTTATPNTEPSIITIPTEIHTTEPSSTATPSNEPTTNTQTTITAVTLEPVTENTTSSLEPGNMTTETSTVETTTVTEPMTTPMPTPKYEVKDGNGSKVCIVVQGTIAFNIEYTKNGTGEKLSIMITVPADANTSQSRCGNSTTQVFKMTFFEDSWSLSVDITEDILATDDNDIKESSLLAASSYSWKKIQLDYIIDERFDNPADPGTIKTSTKKEQTGDFRASLQGSYKCRSGENLEMQDGVRLILGDFQYRAFGTSNSSDFSDDNVANCPTDNGGDDDDGSDTLTIILGSVFGGLGVIILMTLVVVLIRRPHSKDYENI